MDSSHSSQTPPCCRPKRSLFRWAVFAFLVLCVLMIGSCFTSFMKLASTGVQSGNFKVKNLRGGMHSDVWKEDAGATEKLAMVPIEGVISGQHNPYQSSMTDNAIAKIQEATKDESIKGLLLYLNTPGGEVTASDKIYHAAMQFKETGRPVVAYMDTVAASGGYYIACAADEIIATETTITGSIGVIIGGMNGKELLDKVGVKDQTFRSGAFKDTMSMTRDMRADEKAYIQSLVDATYEKFAGIVSQARNIPLAKLKDGIADGRIFHGATAKSVGLVDATGYSEDALAALKKRAGLEKAKTIVYKKEPSIGDLVGILGVKAHDTPEMKIDWGQGTFTSSLKPFVPYAVLEGY